MRESEGVSHLEWLENVKIIPDGFTGPDNTRCVHSTSENNTRWVHGTSENNTNTRWVHWASWKLDYPLLCGQQKLQRRASRHPEIVLAALLPFPCFICGNIAVSLSGQYHNMVYNCISISWRWTTFPYGNSLGSNHTLEPLQFFTDNPFTSINF